MMDQADLSAGIGVEFVSRSPEDTQLLGEMLGKLTQLRDVLLLEGNLGVGKTCFTQGIAWGLEIEGYISSPSFVLLKEYKGRLPLYHVDLYRIGNTEEVIGLGLDDYLYRDGVCVIEWAEKGLSVLPAEHLLVRLYHLSDNERRIVFEPQGERYEDLITDLWS